MNTVGFTKKEAEYFGNIVAQMMRSEEARKAAKPKKAKKAPKMKRAELLKRLKDLLTSIEDCDKVTNWGELNILASELRRVVK